MITRVGQGLLVVFHGHPHELVAVEVESIARHVGIVFHHHQQIRRLVHVDAGIQLLFSVDCVNDSLTCLRVRQSRQVVDDLAFQVFGLTSGFYDTAGFPPVQIEADIAKEAE